MFICLSLYQSFQFSIAYPSFIGFSFFLFLKSIIIKKSEQCVKHRSLRIFTLAFGRLGQVSQELMIAPQSQKIGSAGRLGPPTGARKRRKASVTKRRNTLMGLIHLIQKVSIILCSNKMSLLNTMHHGHLLIGFYDIFRIQFLDVSPYFV